MNILQTEDLVKGMPDQQLMQQAQAPDGQVPQYLLISEVQRRQDMRKRFQAQEEQPQGTVAEQILSGGQQQQPQGMPPTPPQVPAQGRPQQMAPPPQQQPQQMYGGGITRLAGGGQVLSIPDRMGQMHEVSWAGYPDPQTAVEAYFAGQNEPVNIRGMQPGEDQNFSMSFEPNTVQSMGGGSRGYEDIKLDPASQASLQSAFDTSPSNKPEIPSEIMYPYGNESSASDVAFGAFDAAKDYIGRIPEAARSLDFSPENVNKAMSFPFEPFKSTEYVSRIPEAIGNIGGGAGDPSGIGAFADAPEAVSPETEIEYRFDESKRDQLAAAEGVMAQATKGKVLPAVANQDADVMLKNMYGTQSPPVPDLADLIKQQRQDSYSHGLVQLGAGIAGDDLSGGISRAGAVAFRGNQEARDLELQSRLLQYKGEQTDIDRNIEILGKAGVIEAQKYRNVLADTLQQSRNDNETIRLAKAYVGDALDNMYIEQEEGQSMVDARAEAAAAMYRTVLPRDLLERRGLTFFMEQSLDTEIPSIKNDAEYSALKSGTTFTDPNGVTRVKP
jgi:hypothetical protein